LERRLGGGGAGEVYVASGPAAADTTSGQVAVKVSRTLAQTSLGQEMLRQVQAAKDLHDPHIVPILDVTAQDQALLLVMGYAPGGSLGDALRPDAGHRVTLPLRVDVVNRLVTQLARTLVAAHTAGLVHGDLKPSNIFVRTSPGGAPLAALSDFGQGFLTQSAVETLKRGGQSSSASLQDAVEQLRFAAPEQLDGALLPASDQYALAAIAYYLLTGMYPIRADGPDMLRALAQGSVIPPSQLSPVLTEDTDAVLLHALAKRPEQRYPSIGAFALALSGALAASAEAGAPGATQQMNMLRRGAGMPHPAASGVRLESGGSSPHGAAAPSAALPRVEPAFSTQRKLAIFVSLALLVALVSCAVATLAFQSTGTQLPLGGNVSNVTGPNSAPTATPPKQTVSSQQAEERLNGAVNGAAAFSDPLSNNSHGWPVNGKTIFFGSDGRLHLLNQSTQPLAADKPSTAQPANGSFVARVTVELLQGFTGDHAGIRFLVQRNGDGTETYYTYTVTSDGRYDLSFYNGSAGLQFLTAGYGTAIVSGMQKPNTIAVLVDVQQRIILLFANGHYVAQARLLQNGPITGKVGLITVDNGAEASFSDYAVYSAA
jgi:serine/threonine protein kinase